jgi:hypothetical protein
MGVDFLGGPRLDLDGDRNDADRSLVPVAGRTPVTIPGLESFVELRFDTVAGEVELINIDATGTNEGAPGIQAETATVLVTRAGTTSAGQRGEPINPEVDTRLGTLTPFTGDGSLTTVYRIDDLGYEFWYDSIDPFSGSADVLGTFQYLGTMSGWMVERDSTSGAFPSLAGEGLGGTTWPLVNTSTVGNSYVTANGLSGGMATIALGAPGDEYDAAGNGGLALTDFGGDLGAYLDAVIIPALPPGAHRFVYLEAAGFGLNNSFDPVFVDTVAYDAVIIGADLSCPGDLDADGVIGLADLALLLSSYGASSVDPEYNSDADLDGSGTIDLSDLAELLGSYGGTCP